MQLIEVNDHFYNIIQNRESKLVVENTDSSWILGLFDTQSSELVQCEGIGPPICLVTSSIDSFLISGGKLFFILNIGDSGQEGIVHDKRKFLFCVDDIKFDEISTLVQCGLK